MIFFIFLRYKLEVCRWNLISIIYYFHVGYVWIEIKNHLSTQWGWVSSGTLQDSSFLLNCIWVQFISWLWHDGRRVESRNKKFLEIFLRKLVLELIWWNLWDPRGVDCWTVSFGKGSWKNVFGISCERGLLATLFTWNFFQEEWAPNCCFNLAIWKIFLQFFSLFYYSKSADLLAALIFLFHVFILLELAIEASKRLPDTLRPSTLLIQSVFQHSRSIAWEFEATNWQIQPLKKFFSNLSWNSLQEIESQAY